jgi:hypothetical protein
MRDIDNDEREENRQHRFNQRLQRRLINPDRDYPGSYHRQDVIALLQGDMDTEADEPHHYLEGVVDISEGEE